MVMRKPGKRSTKKQARRPAPKKLDVEIAEKKAAGTATPPAFVCRME